VPISTTTLGVTDIVGKKYRQFFPFCFEEKGSVGAFRGYKTNMRQILKILSLNYRAIRIYVLSIILLSMTATRPRPTAVRDQYPPMMLIT